MHLQKIHFGHSLTVYQFEILKRVIKQEGAAIVSKLYIYEGLSPLQVNQFYCPAVLCNTTNTLLTMLIHVMIEEVRLLDHLLLY